jgi:putative transposase
MRNDFDFEAALSALQDGQNLTGKDGILTPLIKLVLSRFSSGYLIANLAIKESDHGTTIR